MALLPELRASGCPADLVLLNGRPEVREGMQSCVAGSGVELFWPQGALEQSAPGLLSFLFKLCRRQKPSILHCHGYKATILTGMMSYAVRIPFVATYHAESRFTPNLAKYIFLETLLLKNVARVAAVSGPIRKELLERKVPEEKIDVIPNGIAGCVQGEGKRMDESASGSGVPRILFMGRLIEKKNVHLLIRAVSNLRETFPEIRLWIAGEGPFRNTLEALVQRLGMSAHVEFKGYVEDVCGLLSRCDCFVLPSQTEGMPIALLEAMSCAVPIVVSSVGSVPEMVRHEQEALLVDPRDEASLLREMRRLLGDPNMRRRLAEQARQRFLNRFTVTAMARRYRELYAKVVRE